MDRFHGVLFGQGWRRLAPPGKGSPARSAAMPCIVWPAPSMGLLRLCLGFVSTVGHVYRPVAPSERSLFCFVR
ncbi:hypothetical protein BN2497_13831 [Janthinobacterium sp. CG23_2]|nr:hypothetical protein BN2497_13831 [Janthinobacterium sp. CG23_2]CUU33313.1 hypothetical protein BN3177_13831 [Janthinobacterium sp. CG23_2]